MEEKKGSGSFSYYVTYGRNLFLRLSNSSVLVIIHYPILDLLVEVADFSFGSRLCEKSDAPPIVEPGLAVSSVLLVSETRFVLSEDSAT